jgi:hypothetical protein
MDEAKGRLAMASARGRAGIHGQEAMDETSPEDSSTAPLKTIITA